MVTNQDHAMPINLLFWGAKRLNQGNLVLAKQNINEVYRISVNQCLLLTCVTLQQIMKMSRKHAIKKHTFSAENFQQKVPDSNSQNYEGIKCQTILSQERKVTCFLIPEITILPPKWRMLRPGGTAIVRLNYLGICLMTKTSY